MDTTALQFADAIDPPDEKPMSQMQREIGDWGRRKGWVFDLRDTPEKFCLMHSEISEALEEYRNGRGIKEIYFTQDRQGNDKPEGIGIELADAVIRILHYCDNFNIPLHALIEMKMAYNERRPYKHGGKLV